MLLKYSTGWPAKRFVKWELTNTYSVPAGWCMCIIFSARQTLISPSSLQRYAIHIPCTAQNACSVDVNFRFVLRWKLSDVYVGTTLSSLQNFWVAHVGDHRHHIDQISQMNIETNLMWVLYTTCLNTVRIKSGQVNGKINKVRQK